MKMATVIRPCSECTMHDVARHCTTLVSATFRRQTRHFRSSFIDITLNLVRLSCHTLVALADKSSV